MTTPPGKSWKVMEFNKTIFQAWKVMENSQGHEKSWKVLENNDMKNAVKQLQKVCKGEDHRNDCPEEQLKQKLQDIKSS